MLASDFFLEGSMKLFCLRARRAFCLGSIAVAINVLTACGGDSGSSPSGNINGTAAIGAPLGGAAIQATCKNGSGTTTANAAGVYSVTFRFDGPCTLTATSGSVVIHSVAAGPGTYNLTPLTELLVAYLAAQLGTTVNGLLTGIQNNTSFQSALSNRTVLTNAEAAVAQIIKKLYGVNLSSTAFLSTAFVTGQPGIDADLDKFASMGAIDATGKPSTALLNAAIAAGAAAPIRGTGGNPTGGTGGTGAT
ncbi:carboxypeptidase regulatory-like domain-containing protein [Caballeronia concitans]|nr:carboxypeptidase regulatory-like domain-containing protein [Caballeronia concitans]